MGYVLHNRLGSGGFVVEATLELAGLDYTYEPIKSEPSTPVLEKIGHINPWGQVPALVLPNGAVLTEVAAMICYLAQQESGCHNGPHLWNTDHASFLRWSIFMSVNIYEGILRRSYPERYFDLSSISDAEPSTNNLVVDPSIKSTMSKSVQMSAKKRVHNAFLLLEEVIQKDEFLLGPKMSSCDIFL
ncbi:MAG: glutathione S-transferase N-terminal domain-containing protein, partial [Chloroflexota bacterium]